MSQSELNNIGWRLLLTGKADGAQNMAVDEAIMKGCAQGLSPRTIRLYGWQPACISVGYFQSLEREIDLDRCKLLGVDYVRRQTGGRVVLHDSELTYSIVTNEQDPLVAGSIKESYRKISEAIVLGMVSLGAEVESQPQAANSETRKRTGICFDWRSDYELTFKGKKLVGSAQFRRDGIVLQHGAILLDVDISKLFSLTRLPEAVGKEKLAEEFGQRVGTLKEALGRKPDFDEVVTAVVQGFEKLLCTELVEGELTLEEEALADDLKEMKYAGRAWNFRK